jgi:hypothetical protein
VSIRNAADFGKLIKETQSGESNPKGSGFRLRDGYSIGKRYGVNHHSSFYLLKPEVHSPALLHDRGHDSPNPKVI